ncbi:mCG1037073, partial [Mus musculus]
SKAYCKGKPMASLWRSCCLRGPGTLGLIMAGITGMCPIIGLCSTRDRIQGFKLAARQVLGHIHSL